MVQIVILTMTMTAVTDTMNLQIPGRIPIEISTGIMMTRMRTIIKTRIRDEATSLQIKTQVMIIAVLVTMVDSRRNMVDTLQEIRMTTRGGNGITNLLRV